MFASYSFSVKLNKKLLKTNWQFLAINILLTIIYKELYKELILTISS